VKVWHTQDFDSLSWHDNHVHALRIEQGEWGAGTLILDIDYIEKWLKSGDRCRFSIVPAHLKFLDVTDLVINLDYRSASAGLTPFSIHDIVRRIEQRERYIAQLWTIEVNWPIGKLEFESMGFEQTALCDAIVSDVQLLEPSQRTASRI
jgi:hypothetical protein